MENLPEYVTPALAWFIVGLVFLIIEFINPGIVIMFFGIGAWIVAAVCLMFDISIDVQLLIFLLTSIISLALLRKWFKKLFVDRFSDDLSEEDEDDLIGKQATVIRAITPKAKGRVEFRGSHWDARSKDDLPKGAIVEIISKDNITLNVKKL